MPIHNKKKIVLTLPLFFLYLLTNNAYGREIQEFALSNGLKVITLEEHKSPVVTFQIWYKVGSKDETMGKTGLSHLLEHMMFKGTQKYEKGEFSRIVAMNGGNENAFTSKDYTAYFETFSSDRIHLSLELEPDRLTNLLLEQEEFELEREVVQEERRMSTEDDPISVVIEDLYATSFKVHPYRSPIIGWMQDLESLTRDDLLTHYKKYYIPNNAIIVVVGDFDIKTLLPKIKEHFENIPKGPEPARVKVVESEQIGERRFQIKREAQLPFFISGFHVPNRGHQDEFALEVLANILSEGKSSRLYKSLVYEKQLALFVGGEYNRISANPEILYFYTGLRPGKKIEELENALLAELERLKTEPVTDLELQKAKNQLEASFTLGQDSIFYQAMLIGQIEAAGGSYRELETFVENIRKVTKEDIMRVARKYLTDKNRTVGVLIPEVSQ